MGNGRLVEREKLKSYLHTHHAQELLLISNRGGPSAGATPYKPREKKITPQGKSSSHIQSQSQDANSLNMTYANEGLYSPPIEHFEPLSASSQSYPQSGLPMSAAQTYAQLFQPNIAISNHSGSPSLISRSLNSPQDQLVDHLLQISSLFFAGYCVDSEFLHVTPGERFVFSWH